MLFRNPLLAENLMRATPKHQRKGTQMAFLIFVFVALLAAGGCTSGQPSSAAKTPPASAASSPRATPVSAQPATAAQYVGDKVCVACHKEVVEKYTKTLMGKTLTAPARPNVQRVDCEACHGPASAHVAAGGGKGKGILVSFRQGVEPAQVQNQPCLKCHESGDRLYWQGSPHNTRDVACVSCHKIMEKASDRFALAKKTQNDTCAQCHLVRKAQSFRNSHMATRDGATQCSSCHNPHGSVTEKLLKGNSVNEACYNCHPEKRGPFLWEHDPVREGCTNCHEPHGTLNDNLLKIRRPRLCQSCHVEGRHPSTSGQPGSFVTVGAGCANCHSRFHGSNHPSGNFFLR